LTAPPTDDWSFALALLVLTSAFFLVLRLLGLVFLALDFEILVIHLPVVVCLLFCAAKKGLLPAPKQQPDDLLKTTA
jgi:hypothetical protein